MNDSQLGKDEPPPPPLPPPSPPPLPPPLLLHARDIVIPRLTLSSPARYALWCGFCSTLVTRRQPDGDLSVVLTLSNTDSCLDGYPSLLLEYVSHRQSAALLLSPFCSTGVDGEKRLSPVRVHVDTGVS
jgi:hypothetical protein